jgi:hypothetical protein
VDPRDGCEHVYAERIAMKHEEAANAQGGAPREWECQCNAALFPLRHTGALTNPHEAFVIGNGDLAASAQVLSHELLLTLGKNDLWDSRIAVSTEQAVLTHDELLRSGGRPADVYRNRGLQSTDYILKSRPGPSPKRVGLIRLTHPGLSDTGLVSELDIARGILTVDYRFCHGRLSVEALLHRHRNCVLIKLAAHGTIPWIEISLEKPPDFADRDMPPPVVLKGPVAGRWSISQTIPGGHGVPEFSWHMGAAFPRSDACAHVWGIVEWPHAVRQDLRLADGESIVFAVGVATDRDGQTDSLQRALELAAPTELEDFETDKKLHVQAWQDFWGASAVELEDKELEALWYRAMYGFACHLKPGCQAPGLNANIPVYDFSAWNGFYTWNHNVQKWYFPALVVNHPEWYEVFADLIEEHRPVFEYLAHIIFGLRGLYCDLMTAPFAPPERAKTHATFGRALAHTGWLAMMLYQHYEFTGDANWLRARAYPHIRGAATFYANYLDKYQNEDGDIYPSIRLEDSGWYEGFVGNRNVVTDLVMFRKAFEVAIRASEILGVDEDRRMRWRKCLDRVPAIEYGWRDGRGWYALCKEWERVWPDFDEYLYHLGHSRWGCAGWVVFPGEQIEGDEEDGLAPVVRDVMSHVDPLSLPDRTRQLGTFHGESVVAPFVRLGMRKDFQKVRALLLSHTFPSGQFSYYSTGEGVYVRSPFCFSWRIVENQYFPILAIAEMLLQSQGGTIRFFPFWPNRKAASFRSLRARGAFLVSAQWRPGEGTRATIASLRGNTCRVRYERGGTPTLAEGGTAVSLKRDGRDVVFTTKQGCVYELRLP